MDPTITHRLLDPSRSQYDHFTSMIDRAVASQSGARTQSRVLDVGAGRPNAGYHDALRSRADHLVGIDPDEAALAENHHLDEATPANLAHFASTTDEQFDLVVAVYVIEHVEDPDAFLCDVSSLLRPGGRFIGITPNLWHYFGLLARAARAVRIDETLLRLLRPNQLVEDYHYELHYRLNTARRLSSSGRRAHLCDLDIGYLEDAGVFEPYLPGFARRSAALHQRWVYEASIPSRAGTMLFSMTAG